MKKQSSKIKTKQSVNPATDTIPVTRSTLSPIDIITLAYCLWIMLYMMVGWGRAVQPERHFPVYLSVVVAVLFMAWWDRSQMDQAGLPRKLLGFVRSIYPVLLFGYFYTGLFVVTRIVFRDWLDPFFMKIDHQLFGYYPSLTWGIKHSNRIIHEIFAFGYFSYYPMIVGLPVYLYFKNRKAFEETIFVLSFVFYLYYFVYSLVPVIGGRYFDEAMLLSRQSGGYLFSGIMANIYSNSKHLGGAFPSSHVAIAIVLCISALRHTKIWGYIFCSVTLILVFATVFLHYHWFIDAVAGVVTGIPAYFLALRARQLLTRKMANYP
ncbi:MAG: phosphatase PAP2 family protein [Candidatus Cloacimonetes bacterium]|nr:phosphatase PAP2 family protein [Candidatus Cloacimonadota bacterium]